MSFEKCKLCNKFMMTPRKKSCKKHEDTVHIKGDLFGKYLDMIFHERCWNRIYGKTDSPCKQSG